MNKENILKWIKKAENKNLFNSNGFIKENLNKEKDLLFSQSVNLINKDLFMIICLDSTKALLVCSEKDYGFDGIKINNLLFCDLNHINIVFIRKLFSFTSPSPLSKFDITIGLGDRLGVASPGHIKLFKKYIASPVLAQQSVRELNLTGRTYEDVLDAASWAVFQEGYQKPWGADGDHLKSEDWVIKALEIGFTMITADVSDFIHKQYFDMNENEIIKIYEKLDPDYRKKIEEKYLNLNLTLDCGETIKFTKIELIRIVLIYKEAVEHALRLFNAGISVKKEFDFELSIDETQTPTTAQAHVFVAMESQNLGIKISSLAPRFIGEFQKGIDYIGDVKEFSLQFKIHSSIAGYFGYRISVHSGSDKFKVFPVVGKMTKGKYHLKTAGTNWLQALEVISEKKPDFFRELYDFALSAYPVASKYYHITPDMKNVIKITNIKDDKLPELFKNPDIRQVLHIAYGEILQNKKLNETFYKIINEFIEEYWVSLENHIGKHLKLLGVDKI